MLIIIAPKVELLKSNLVFKTYKFAESENLFLNLNESEYFIAENDKYLTIMEFDNYPIEEIKKTEDKDYYELLKLCQGYGGKVRLVLEKEKKKIILKTHKQKLDYLYSFRINDSLIISKSIKDIIDNMNYKFIVNELSFKEFIENGKIFYPNSYFEKINILNFNQINFIEKDKSVMAIQFEETNKLNSSNEFVDIGIEQIYDKSILTEEEIKVITDKIINYLTSNSRLKGQPEIKVEMFDLKMITTNHDCLTKLKKNLINTIEQQMIQKLENHNDDFGGLFSELLFEDINSRNKIDKLSMRLLNLFFIHNYLKLEK